MKALPIDQLSENAAPAILRPTSTRDADVLVVGGGIAGTVAALALADGRRRVIILEASGGTVPRFGGECFQPLAVDLLARIGALEGLRAAGAAPVEGFAIFSDSLVPAQAPVLLPYVNVGRRGGPGQEKGLALRVSELVRGLRDEAASRKNIRFCPYTSIASPLLDGSRVVGVRDNTGADWTAPLTLVAQGRRAPLRGALGFTGKPRVLSLSAGLVVQGVTLPQPGFAHIFLGASGPVVLLPFGDGSIRVSIDLPAQSDRQSLATRILAHHITHLPGELVAAIRKSLLTDRLDVRVNCAFHTARCAAPGVALIGDAAGCTHSLTGTGMMICLVDACILREELRNVDLGQASTVKGAKKLNSVLVRYQNRRYRFARPRESLAELLYHVFCESDVASRTMCRSLQSRWRDNRRARAISLKLLSGDISSMLALRSEYAGVARQAIFDTVLGSRPDGASLVARLGHRAWTLFSILKLLLGNLYRRGSLPRTPSYRETPPLGS